MKKSKIKSIGSVPKEVIGDKGTFYYFKIELENGDKGSIGSTDKSPKFLSVGSELEYNIKETEFGGQIKRVNNFSKGGGSYKKPKTEFKYIKRMVKSNALHACNTINTSYGEKKFPPTALAVIEKFTLGNIEGDIDKWSEEDNDLTSRLACINNAAIMAGIEKYTTGEELVAVAENYYKYIIK